MSRFRSFRRGSISLAVVAVLAFAAPSAFAGGNGAVTDTQNFHNVPMTFVVGPQCGAPAGTVSGTFNAVMHITINKAGDVWITALRKAGLRSSETTDDADVRWPPRRLVRPQRQQPQQRHSRHLQRPGDRHRRLGTTIAFHAVDHISVSASAR
jgi:hypothetical protein